MNDRSGRKVRGAAPMVLALGMLLSPHAPAQPAGAGSPAAGRYYAFGGFALFAPDTNDQLQGEREGLGVIGGGGFRLSPLLSFELGVLGAGRRIDTPAVAAPPAGTFRDGTLRTNIGSGGLNLAVKFHFTLDRIEPYVGAGIGRYTTSFRTTSEASTCLQHCADTGPRVTSRSRDTGYHAVIGADYHIRAKDVIAVEFRQLRLDADFDEIGLGKIKAGGSLLWLGYRRYF
jgi:opacity protein-like surface antigen